MQTQFSPLCSWAWNGHQDLFVWLVGFVLVTALPSPDPKVSKECFSTQWSLEAICEVSTWKRDWMSLSSGLGHSLSDHIQDSGGNTPLGDHFFPFPHLLKFFIPLKGRRAQGLIAIVLKQVPDFSWLIHCATLAKSLNPLSLSFPICKMGGGNDCLSPKTFVRIK